MRQVFPQHGPPAALRAVRQALGRAGCGVSLVRRAAAARTGRRPACCRPCRGGRGACGGRCGGVRSGRRARAWWQACAGWREDAGRRACGGRLLFRPGRRACGGRPEGRGRKGGRLGGGCRAGMGGTGRGAQCGRRVHFGLRAHILQKTFACLETVPLDDLTVSAVCREAGVSRTTFYRLFSGKHDVYNWFLRVTMRSNLAQSGKGVFLDRALLLFFRSLDANRKLSQEFFAVESRQERHAGVPRVRAALACALGGLAARRRGGGFHPAPLRVSGPRVLACPSWGRSATG